MIQEFALDGTSYHALDQSRNMNAMYYSAAVTIERPFSHWDSWNE